MALKPYVRGGFRAIKTRPKPYSAPKFTHYEVQAKVYGKEHDCWVTIEVFDYLGNARLRVRNLHAACAVTIDIREELNKAWAITKPDSKPF